MLRTVLLCIAAVVTLCGGAAALSGIAEAGQPFLWALGLLICVWFERWRYRKPSAEGAPNANWQKTGEQFIDPASGEAMEVLYDAQSGERQYRPVKKT